MINYFTNIWPSIWYHPVPLIIIELKGKTFKIIKSVWKRAIPVSSYLSAAVFSRNQAFWEVKINHI